ncbi:hypothetical protein AZE42_04844 [Rhizopogon vesiculosus]|uniref:EF-hand domain-containing protein n=3 Tax=Boletales TaxID=68889 RepID=A0A1J8QQ52_9AGAM|nr:hypothetical protein AZE42_04844 [Rhizopogon vesiculosus]
MRDRLRTPPSYRPVSASDHNSEEDQFVNSTPSPPYRRVPSTSQLVLDPSSPPYRSHINLASSYEMDAYRPQHDRQESGIPPSERSVTQVGSPLHKPSVHYPEDVNSPPAPSYFNGHKTESHASSDEEEEEEEFDWSGDEDLHDEEAKFEKKMGSFGSMDYLSYQRGQNRLVTLLFSSLIGSTFLAAVLATPAILVHFFWYKPHSTEYRHYVDINLEAWLFWAAANVVISWGLAMAIDIVPAIIRLAIAISWGHVSETVKTKLELYDSIKDTVKPLFYAASAWLSWIILFQNIFGLYDPHSQSYAPYTDRVAQTIEFLFFFALVLCIQRMLSHFIAFAFHRTAYQERLDDVKDALKVIEELRNYKPKPSGRHKSSGTHTPMFGALTGLMTPFGEKDPFNLLSSRLHSETPQPSDDEEADVEDQEKAKKQKEKRKGKGKGKHKQRDSRSFELLEESSTNSPTQGGSVATTATHSPVDVEKHATHKYPPTLARRHSQVDAHDDDPTIVVQAAKAFKAAILHDARNIKGTNDEQAGLVFSVNSTHEATRLAKAIYRTFKDRRRTYLVPSDLYPAFATQDEAKEAFRVFDKDNNGDISRAEIKSTLLRVYKERRFLSRSMRDVGAALKTLDQILLIFALVILLFVSLSIFGVNVTQSLTSVYSLGLAASFVFKNSASNVFDAIMFLFVTHPFDTGDRCFIDNENLVVKKMGLFATIFARSDGTETYYFNSQLFTKFITNVRRSDKMAESCTIQVAWRTPQEKLDALEGKLNAWLATEENRWFQPTTKVILQNITYQRYLECTIGIPHNSYVTWQDWGLRNMRRTAFHAAVQHYCRDLGISAYEAPMPVTYANPDTQQYDPAQEAVLPDTASEIRSPVSPRSPGAAPKGFLGFTPPDQASRLNRHLTRVRKSKSSKAAPTSDIRRLTVNASPNKRPRKATQYQFTFVYPIMFRNTYDSDNTVFSPQGRLHQVEYALEAVKQGSAAVGLRSKTHAILLALKRSTGELASYQQKMFRVDDHVGIAIAGLTSDARVLSNFMRQQAMGERMMFNRPMPVNRLVTSIADKAQVNTQEYGRRPYGVGFLVIGQDQSGPHLFEFSPSGNSYEYYAMSIGARSQSAKTYLERHYESFADCNLEDLIRHGLHALRETLQQDKELNVNNTSIGIIGPMGQHEKPISPPGSFRILENEKVEVYLQSMEKKEEAADPVPAPVPAPAAAPEAAADDDVQMSG